GRLGPRADLQGDVQVPGEVLGQLADARQVAVAHLLDDEGIGGIEDDAVGALLGLQGFEPGMDVLGRKFGFEAFQTAGPGIHRKGKARRAVAAPPQASPGHRMGRVGTRQPTIRARLFPLLSTGHPQARARPGAGGLPANLTEVPALPTLSGSFAPLPNRVPPWPPSAPASPATSSASATPAAVPA